MGHFWLLCQAGEIWRDYLYEEYKFRRRPFDGPGTLKLKRHPLSSPFASACASPLSFIFRFEALCLPYPSVAHRVS